MYRRWYDRTTLSFLKIASDIRLMLASKLYRAFSNFINGIVNSLGFSNFSAIDIVTVVMHCVSLYVCLPPQFASFFLYDQVLQELNTIHHLL